MNISRIINAIFIFIIIFSIIYILKPSFIFKKNGDLKEFGVNSEKGETIFHLGVVTIGIAILSFWFISVKDYSDSVSIEEMKIIEQLNDSLKEMNKVGE